jgi:lipopolysaccharide export system permease protein
MKFIDNLVGKGLSWWVIIQLITLNLAWMVTLAGPMAVLVASLMAFGSLSSNNEITVIQTSGLSLPRMMMPVLIVVSILCYALIVFNNNVLPEANHRTRTLMSDIQRTKPMFAIEPGRFSDDISGYNLLVNKTFPETNKLEGILIFDNSNPATSNILTAERGEISFSKDFTKIILDLYDGEIHQLGKKNVFEDYRTVKFDKHVVSIDAQGFGFSKSDENAFSRGDRELSADSMRNIVKKIRDDQQIDKLRVIEAIGTLALDFVRIRFDSVANVKDSVTQKQNVELVLTLRNRFGGLKTRALSQRQIEAANQRQIDMYRVEIHKKYSIPFACIVFVMIGAPLGVITRRGGFGVAAGMSLGFFLLYWAFLIGGEKLADREFLSPFLSMWSANFLLGFAGLYLTFRNSVNINKISNYLKSINKS